MSQKSAFKLMVENIIEEAIVSSTHIGKLISSVTAIANESRKIAETILILNDRLNSHEELILKLAQLQRTSAKDPTEIDFSKSKQKPQKPN